MGTARKRGTKGGGAGAAQKARVARAHGAANESAEVKVGLCGFTVGMERYARSFSVVEVQQTFYEPPADKILERWVAKTPPGFEFTMKAWQLVTHEGGSPTYRRMKHPLDANQRATCGAFRDSEIVRHAFARTLECAHVLSATALLFQCPASFRPDAVNVERLRVFFERIANPARPAGLRYLWEPRGPAWSQAAALARDLCRELGLVHVIDPFVTDPEATNDGPTYWRLHGITGARHVYTDRELRRLASMTPPSAYVMFNNIPRVDDAERFLAIMSKATKR